MTYNTEMRARIVAYLKERGGTPTTILEICDALLEGESGKSTVYRLVAKLCREGALRKISDPASRRVTYQYIHSGHCSEHLHLKCRECGEMLHLGEKASHELEARLMSEAGFALDEGALIYGVCRECTVKGGR